MAQWRGVDLGPVEKAQADCAKAAGQVVPGLLRGLGLDRRRLDLEVLRIWNHCIDPQVVAHARPTGLRNGTLYVAVDHSVWLAEIIRYRRKEILERLQQGFGKECIARISYRIG